MSNGVDGKLYIIDENEAYLHIIDNPNVRGLGCNLRRGTKGIVFPIQNNITVFPNVVNLFLGESECSIIPTQEKNTYEHLRLIPNPGNDKIFIDGIAQNDIKIITIFNNVGQIVGNKNDAFLDMKDLQTGIYFIQVVSIDGQKKTMRWIKQ